MTQLAGAIINLLIWIASVAERAIRAGLRLVRLLKPKRGETVEKKVNSYRAAKCPVCGKFMDKVEAVVLNQLSGGTVPVSTSMDDAVVAWVCPNLKCNKPDQ
ncbi:MAG TPA: hypothetical protein VMW64_07460 [Dehalococcoidia bacterium]|nr:hypothetical protein [Dehalococcoidia bacterium]